MATAHPRNVHATVVFAATLEAELLWDVGGRALAGSRGRHGRDRRSFDDLS